MRRMWERSEQWIKDRRRRHFRLEETLVVAGCDRSGTTWLANILANGLGRDYFHEPLRPADYPEAYRAGFEFRTYVAPDEDRPDLRAYLERVLTGRIGDIRFPPRDSPAALARGLLGRPRLLVKFVRVNRMLGWLEQTSPLRGIVFILRHPCAAVASAVAMGERLNGSYKYVRAPDPGSIATAFGGRIPDHLVDRFGDILAHLRNREETLAVYWALDNYLALLGNPAPRAVVTTYERLMPHGVEEAQRILDCLGLAGERRRLARQLRRPSLSASADLRAESVRVQLTKWRRQLDGKTAERILQIARGFQLGFYREGGGPVLALLFALLSRANLPQITPRGPDHCPLCAPAGADTVALRVCPPMPSLRSPRGRSPRGPLAGGPARLWPFSSFASASI